MKNSRKHSSCLDNKDFLNMKFKSINNSYPIMTAPSRRSVLLGLVLLLGSLVLATSLQAASVNDNFASATVISGSSVTATGSNVGATKEAGEPNIISASPGGHSVWWFWTAPASGSVTVSLAGSS